MRKGEVDLNNYKKLVSAVLHEIYISNDMLNHFGSIAQKEIVSLNSELFTEEYRIKRGIASVQDMTDDDHEQMYFDMIQD